MNELVSVLKKDLEDLDKIDLIRKIEDKASN